MGLLRSQDHGHSLRDELNEHVAYFHEGLNALEDRLLHRQGVVESRMADLEDEHAAIGEGLDEIADHRGMA